MRRDDLAAQAEELEMRLDTIREEMGWAEDDGDEETHEALAERYLGLEDELESVQINIRNLDELGYIPGEIDYYPSPMDIAQGWF